MFMEKLYRRMILLVAGLGCLACSEQETPVYEGLDFVNLESKQVSLSFDLLPVEDTLLTFNVKVMGYLAENEREVQVVATEGTTAQEGTDFRMEKCTIPANEIAGELKCRVFKPVGLQEGDSLIINLLLKDSEDLLAGIRTTAKIKIEAGLPSVWSGDWWTNYCHELVYGTYLKEKFRFLIRILKSVEKVNTVGMDIGARSDWQLYFYTELTKFEKDNGPLIDKETGERVTFPGTF